MPDMPPYGYTNRATVFTNITYTLIPVFVLVVSRYDFAFTKSDSGMMLSVDNSADMFRGVCLDSLECVIRYQTFINFIRVSLFSVQLSAKCH